MKILTFIFCLLSLNAMASSIEGSTFKCEQRFDRKPMDPKVGYLEVTVKIKKDITNRVRPNESFEKAYSSTTEIVRVVNGKRVVVKPSFSATATTFDVILSVWANKTQGIGIKIYLDEFDSSTLTVTDSIGNKQVIGLNCQ